MSSDSRFIKHYDNITPMLKLIFYYGSYSRKDMDETGACKKSKYYGDSKPLEYVFGDMLEKHVNASGEEALSLRNDYFEDPQRLLMKFFALQSISVNKLLVSLFLLQLLRIRNRPMSNKEIQEKVDSTGFTTDADGNPLFSEKTLYNWIDSMASCGILLKSDNKKYSLSDDLLCEGVMTQTVREKLLWLTEFCSNVLPLSVCGGSVRTKLRQDYRSLFLFKHRYPGQIFDDELIWKLLIYIQNRQPICFTYSSVAYHAPFLPCRIVTEKASGRQYLFAVCVNGDSLADYMLRVDKLRDVRPADKPYAVPDAKTLEQRYTEALRHSFSGLYIPRGKKKKLVSGTLVFVKQAEREVLRRFPDAVITPVDDAHSSADIQVYQMDELKPWLRSNVSRIRLTASSDGTARELREELAEWRKMYGIQ